MNTKRAKNLMIMLENDHKINTGKNLFEQEFSEASLSEFIDFLNTLKDSTTKQITLGEFLQIVKANKQNFSNWISKNSYSDSSNTQTFDEWFSELMEIIEQDPVLNGLYKEDNPSGYANARYFEDWVTLINEKVLPYYKDEVIEDIGENLRNEGFSEDQTKEAEEALAEIYEGTYQERVLKTDFNGEEVAFYFPNKNIIKGKVLIDFNFVKEADKSIVKDFLKETDFDGDGYDQFVNTDAHKLFKNKVLISSEELSGPIVISKSLLLPLEFKDQADVLMKNRGSVGILKKLMGGKKPDTLVDKIANIDMNMDKIEKFLQSKGLGAKKDDAYGDSGSEKIKSFELAMDSSEKNSLFVKIIDVLVNDFDKSISIELQNNKIKFDNLEQIDTRTFKTKSYIIKLKEQYKRSYDFSNVQEIQFIDTNRKMAEYVRRNVDKIEYDETTRDFTTPGVEYKKGMLILKRDKMNG